MREAGDCIIRFERVTKSYGPFVAIHELNLDVARGEFLTLLGPSGSGKTTTLMMLAGFEMPTSGSILMDGKHIERTPTHQRDIGVVFQNYALFPHLSVAQNLAFPLSVRGVPKTEIDARVIKALKMVHLEAMGGRRPAQLSGGQQQRVALARATIFTPRLIVLDEPLGALDKNLREQMQLELKQLHRQLGITMVFVTHDQSEALTMSDRVAVFNKGRIEQIDTPEALYERPATPFVASFIGENNLLHGRAEAVGSNEIAVRLVDGALLRACPGPAARISPGAAVTVSLRPERLGVATSDAPSGQSLRATVSEVIYLGDIRRVLVTAEGVGELTIKFPAHGGIPIPSAGQQITLTVSPEACLALAADA